MKFVRWIAKLFKRTQAAKVETRQRKSPLREFVYLDEVSLRSLLSSQRGEITDGTSQQVADALTAEVSAKVGADVQVAKTELASRFQTTNSSTLQTSRKATVQSWFRELHTIPNLRLIEPRGEVPQPHDSCDLIALSDPSVVTRASELARGELVEFRVTLAADPVFRLGTMVTEFSGMADDFPEMFGGNSATATLREVQPINKILQRLLAGLIPVRAVAIDYKVVKVEGVEYVVHEQALRRLDLPMRPLEIVGVTEHLAYWKDIRRVLFSDAAFTLLCRVSRTGLHETWTPVKLADLFSDLTPDLVHQINAVGKVPLSTYASPPATEVNSQRLVAALTAYKDAVLMRTGGHLAPEMENRLALTIADAAATAGSISDQRNAFARVGRLLAEASEMTLDRAEDLALREAARIEVGLPLFPALAREPPQTSVPAVPSGDDDVPRILDVEVVAIYW